MDTQQLRTIQHPGHLGDLLDSLVGARQLLPGGVLRVVSAGLLPAPLRLLSRIIERRDCQWRAWTDGTRFWFFEASFALDPSRERGKPVVRLTRYDEAGDVAHVLSFVATAEHGWQQCA